MSALSWNEALSGIFGTISLASWVFLLVPQLIENAKNGHTEGLSTTFLLVWFLGDLTNLIGAVWAGLVPTVIALAAYFCVADAVLLGQVFYYRVVNKKRKEQADDGGKTGVEGETAPLLADGHVTSPKVAARKRHSLTDVRDDNMGLPGSRRRSSTASSKSRPRQRTMSSGQLSPVLEEPTRTRAWLKNTLAVICIIAAGTAAWAIAWKLGAWKPTPIGHEDDTPGDSTPVGAEVLGYISAVLYLGARLPQIMQNYRQRSTEGLSLLFFLLSILGNATYAAGILFHSVEKQYLLTNTPWILGSAGTLFEDIIIFLQFNAYGEKKEVPDEAVE